MNMIIKKMKMRNTIAMNKKKKILTRTKNTRKNRKNTMKKNRM